MTRVIIIICQQIFFWFNMYVHNPVIVKPILTLIKQSQYVNISLLLIDGSAVPKCQINVEASHMIIQLRFRKL